MSDHAKQEAQAALVASIYQKTQELNDCFKEAAKLELLVELEIDNTPIPMPSDPKPFFTQMLVRMTAPVEPATNA